MEASTAQASCDKIFNVVFEAVKHQLGYFTSYKSNIENLRTQVTKLEEARERVKHAVETANRNGEETEAEVQNWLIGVDEITAKAKKFLDEGQEKMMGAEGWCPNLKSRYQLSRKATKTAQVTIAEIQNADKFNQVAYRPAPQGLTNVASTAFTAFESRTLTLKEIMEALGDPNINMIGVYGLSGVGKTTLVKEVATQAKEEKLFNSIIMVSVKENPDLKKIQGEVADKLGLKFDEETDGGRAGRLRDRMSKKEENILVILDDLWAKLNLEEVGIPFGDAHQRCKILLTSRTRDILTVKMGTQKHFELVALSEEEAWSLFEKVALVSDDVTNTNLKTVATKVAKRCVGLPVLIVAVAMALKGKDLHIWKDALKDLEMIDNEWTEAKVIKAALELSYNNLGDGVKSMFLLCGLLPKSDIAIGCLLQYAMGLGLLGDLTFEDARNKVHKLIDDLKGQCLLLDGETNEQFKMHDLIHDFAVFVASRDRHACTNDWPKKDMLEKCTMISFPSKIIEELPEGLEYPNLKLLLLLGKTDGDVKIPETFFEGIKNLKVMALSKMHVM